MHFSQIKILLFSFLIMFFSCKEQPIYLEIEQESIESRSIDWEPARIFYLNSLNNSIEYLKELETIGALHKDSRIIFAMARSEYKKAENFAAYLNPPVANRVNGPSISDFNTDKSTIIPPMGLQRIEECIYTSEVKNDEFAREIDKTIALLEVLKNDIIKRELTPQRFFISIHQQLIRVITHSITGFDTPMSYSGLGEAVVSLKSLKVAYEKSIRDLILAKNPELDKEFIQNVDDAVRFIENENSFENFDRYIFIRNFLNPITRNWVEIRKISGLWAGTSDLPFNFDSPTFFEKDFFNLDYFLPSVNRNFTDAQIALGEKLFFDKKLSKKGNMSCATCHVPELSYSSGLTLDKDNEGFFLERNTPTLINVVFQKNFFWDGRSENLIDQISSVFINSKEFNIGVHSFSEELLKDPVYEEMFINAFGEISRRNLLSVKAISAYLATLNGLNSKFDKNIRNEENTFTKSEMNGFNLFMGKAKCATCHFLPLTNGTLPPFYKKSEREVLGIPETSQNNKVDDDFGFYWKYKTEVHRGAFKTPTLRNITETAPYMHNGVFESLEEVIEFYNMGGGQGLGFEVTTQTLPDEKLNLSAREKADLISFMKTLKDLDAN
ncbi:cytochrome-c peroxidase [Christiangramia aquimixticola]|uniref:cytochrome-c peroxidase n=1 Tax=Christiangramia aquimixticola TaxID=1697558 RepID=UPI003AA80DAB